MQLGGSSVDSTGENWGRVVGGIGRPAVEEHDGVKADQYDPLQANTRLEIRNLRSDLGSQTVL